MMAHVNFCISLLLLYLTRGSLQGGVKPQGNGSERPYFTPVIRGAGGIPPGDGLGAVEAKTKKYSAYGNQGLPAGPGVQPGFGAAQGFGGKPEKPGGPVYGNSAGYGAGYRRNGYHHLAHHPLSGHGILWQHPVDHGLVWSHPGQGRRGKPFKEGYFGGVGAGGFPSNGVQNGFGNGYGARDNRFLPAGPQPGVYGNGGQIPYRGQVGGPPGIAASAAAVTKYRGAGHIPYNEQPQQPETPALGDYSTAGRYGETRQPPYGVPSAGLGFESKARPLGYESPPAQVGYESSPAQAIGPDANGNGLGYSYSTDFQANGPGAGPYGPSTMGQVQGQYGPSLLDSPRQTVGEYRGKESKDRTNRYLRNGYKALPFWKTLRGNIAQKSFLQKI